MVELTQLTPVFDVLRRRRPDLVADLGARYPDLKRALEGQRSLGAENAAHAQEPAAEFEVAKAALSEAKQDLNEVLGVLNKRGITLARLRLAGGAISSISSAGMIAALGGTSFAAQISTASIAFASSILTLGANYIEDFSGGDGSVRRIRELMTAQVRRLAEIDGEMKSALLLRDTEKILAGLTGISAVLGEVQFARAQLGLTI